MLNEDDIANRDYKSSRESYRRSRTSYEHHNSITNRVLNYKLKNDIEKARNGGSKMLEFAKGIRVKVQPTQYGEIIKLGINMEEFKQNPVNERGYVNIDILTSKEGKKYAKINDYKADGVKTTPTDEEEIPF